MTKEEYIQSLPKIGRIAKSNPYDMRDDFASTGLDVVSMLIPKSDFDSYLARIDYQGAFPRYYAEFGPQRQPPHIFKTKCLEHYLSFLLCRIFDNPDSKVMDVAASNSPVQRVLEKLGHSNAWRQDIQFKTDLEARCIGGDASRIDCPDETFDALLLHNSWEHFEGESPSQFLSEAQRILRPGGRVCIIPLFCNLRPFSLTSPGIWESKYRNVTDFPIFDPDLPVVLDEAPKQRLIRVVDGKILARDLARAPGLNWKVLCFENASDYKFDPFALLGTKPNQASSS